MSKRDPFKRRPLRLKPCPNCAGCGATVDSYALAKAWRRIKGAPKGALCASVVGASGIFESCREAADLAKSTKQPVVFDFNEQLVVVRAGDDPDEIARAWWKRVYKETPEQSAARR